MQGLLRVYKLQQLQKPTTVKHCPWKDVKTWSQSEPAVKNPLSKHTTQTHDIHQLVTKNDGYQVTDPCFQPGKAHHRHTKNTMENCQIHRQHDSRHKSQQLLQIAKHLMLKKKNSIEL